MSHRMMLRRLLCATIVASATAVEVNAQTLSKAGGDSGTMALFTAARATQSPAIDASDTDDVWRGSMIISDFRVFDPTEDGTPAFRTEARFAFDARTLYVFVRMYDPRPDSIVALLSRRDVRTQSDQIKIMIDSYHDRRTGYEFAVNPAGVKRDYYISDDSREDISWDAVWDVATRIDSLGWTAEFSIPLSQMRFSARGENSFGVMIMRDVARSNERYSWPLYRRSRPGISSQFAPVGGFTALASPRRIELMPYVVTRNVTNLDGRAQEQAAGGDVKVGLGSNLTLTAAINPDFGQVEADPAVLNLTAFEQSFAELRPFFVEGSGAYGQNQTIFYSRRIGRAPQLSGLASGDANIPTSTPIAAAAKLTGRFGKGFTIGSLAAYTNEQSIGDVVIEPSTLYAITRIAREFRGGNSVIGATGTVVDRSLDAGSEDFLRDRAYVGGFDLRHRMFGRKYELRGSLTGSRVEGDADAIARTQRNSVHYYHRPDSPLEYDPTRTALDGVAGTASFQKVSGAFQYYGSYKYYSPGFESNDLGFQSRVDQQILHTYASLASTKPAAFYRNASAVFDLYGEFTHDGLPIYNFVQVQGYSQFKNNSSITLTSWRDNAFAAYCDRCARGGPALRVSPVSSVLVNWNWDTRAKVVPYFAAIYTTADEGRSYLWRVRPLVAVRSGARLSWELGARYQKNLDNTQWVQNVGAIGADSTHYVFGRLHQDLLSFQARVNYTVTPALSLQLYAEPFVSTGSYSDMRELSATPRAGDYDARFRPYTARPIAADFNVKEFNSNAVVRWEYRPGSAVYLVWQQGRFQDDRNAGEFRARRDYGDLFSTRPDNTFLIKASYWLNL
jgi:hypothetical protein